MTDVSIMRGRFGDIDMHKEFNHLTTESKTEVIQPASQGMPAIIRSQEETKKDSFLETSEGTLLFLHPDFRILRIKPQENIFCCFKPCSL